MVSLQRPVWRLCGVTFESQDVGPDCLHLLPDDLQRRLHGRGGAEGGAGEEVEHDGCQGPRAAPEYQY